MEIYAEDQAEVIFKFLRQTPEWFILGGPADGNEAQTLVKKYPNLKCVGLEPNVYIREKQQALSFPGQLLPYALWSSCGHSKLEIPTGRHRCGFLTGSRDSTNLEFEAYDVELKTLDVLSKELGPFNEVVLWMDIEGSELEALKGAKDLFARKAIILTNLEVFDNKKPEIMKLMESYGMKLEDHWGVGSNDEEHWANYIFVRR